MTAGIHRGVYSYIYIYIFYICGSINQLDYISEDCVHIFGHPTSMDLLVRRIVRAGEAADEMLRFDLPSVGEKKCVHCFEPTVKKCRYCRSRGVSRYLCSQECAVADWKKGHGAVCRQAMIIFGMYSVLTDESSNAVTAEEANDNQ